jgi:hypothetical protein
MIQSPSKQAIDTAMRRHRRPRRIRLKLLAATATAALALPAIAAAQPVPADPGNPVSGGSAASGAPADRPELPNGVVLRRDGSKATAFVPTTTSTASDNGDEFAWGDAALGAGAALGLVAIASGGLALRRRGTLATGRATTAH